MTRVAIFLAVIVVVFLPLNVIVYRGLAAIHSRRRLWIRAAFAVGNLMWPFLPLLSARTGFSRLVRALLGPPWFAWLCFLILYSALLLLLLLAWLPFHRRTTYARFARWPSTAFLAALLLGSAIGVYDALVPLRVVHVPVTIAGLPPQFEGYRFVLAGDLHVGLLSRDERVRTIFAAIRDQHPDAVLLAGDLIDDDPHFVPKLLRGVETLDRATPVYGVYGNHEIYGDPIEYRRLLAGSRIALLVNEGVAIRRGGATLWLAGLSDYAAISRPDLAPDVRAALAHRPEGALPIVFAHQPRAFDDARRLGVPLVLAAHTHGGQLGVRSLGWSLAGVFLRYHMGLYHAGASQLYVTTGAGHWLLPFRLGMTPEIVVIELRRGASGATNS